ncbi:uncharacterized protein B0H64DRAFT_317276 [Chaetomium fimeti]|uniref:Modin n=1 Tax=Chaetomium fimeti TaxID=1854472 RepID=A0AAE0HKW0_9PEZI|nr:hypothetical protein B0H64DRAFT_317276 [Chaetomium fimeti]
MSVPQQKVRTAPNCGPEVMGAWSALTRRIWRPTEFRFETQFEVPVIFVCPPSNKEGPIKNKPINFVCGTQRSLEATRVLLPRDEEKMESMRADRVHAADNEKASWVTLLSQLQSMETESQEWQLKHSRTGPRMATPSTEFYNHTLAVAIQTQTQSWDAMPPSVKKPCATTTFSHLLEIAAMMGMHWKEFNQSEKRYRAEGNGCMLRGTHIPELGLMFTFQVYGRVEFLGNRVIPVGEVRELCCGFVPTLFQETNKHQRRIDSPIRDLRDLNFLQLSSRDRIAETMVMVGCNTNTANYFCSHETKHSHLFPVPFELMGMLGKTLHIRNSAFRMLPNPTPYQWSTNSFELPQLVKEYWKNITASDLDLPRVPHVKKLGEDTSLLLEALYRDAKSRTPAYSIPLLNTVHDILDRCDNFLRGSDSDLVRIVVGEHFQAVLKMVNEERRMSNGDGRRGGRRRAEHFSELTAASPELREEVFMDLYFYKVFGQVRERAVTWCEQRRTAPRAGSGSPREPPAASVSAIWCTLVLRMMCWLLLHDFHRKDVQIPKSELLGSRIPVYIS